MFLFNDVPSDFLEGGRYVAAPILGFHGMIPVVPEVPVGSSNHVLE